MFEKYLNKIQERITYISGREYTASIFSIEGVLIAFSIAYGLSVRFRRMLYEKGFLPQKKLSCFVISIGNIVVGGAGKTPMAIYIANLLKEMGKQPVVISRGYKGRYKEKALIVSDGTRIFSDAEDSGDEPYMMAKQRSFPVVVGKDRFDAGMKAIDTFNPDVIILDDGFQHLKLKKDFDILLFDYLNPLGNKRLLPAGRLREMPMGSCHRANAIIFTRSSDKNQKEKSIEELLSLYPNCPWFRTFHKPYVCQQIGDDINIKADFKDIDLLNGKRAFLFSGIANNDSFYQSVLNLNITVLHHLEFKDHYRYKRSDILLINRMAKKAGADIILTTEKDWVKLDQDIKWEINLVVIGIQIVFEHPEKFKTLLALQLEKK